MYMQPPPWSLPSDTTVSPLLAGCLLLVILQHNYPPQSIATIKELIEVFGQLVLPSVLARTIHGQLLLVSLKDGPQGWPTHTSQPLLFGGQLTVVYPTHWWPLAANHLQSEANCHYNDTTL
mmetsp:Transcript_41497/g.74442  ORF Transcript_41497/g.74442 Transcript_41497/m.74442 type:complete len:121 (-) Transcript_41497:56-418(-)